MLRCNNASSPRRSWCGVRIAQGKCWMQFDHVQNSMRCCIWLIFSRFVYLSLCECIFQHGVQLGSGGVGCWCGVSKEKQARLFSSLRKLATTEHYILTTNTCFKFSIFSLFTFCVSGFCKDCVSSLGFVNPATTVQTKRCHNVTSRVSVRSGWERSIGESLQYGEKAYMENLMVTGPAGHGQCCTLLPDS